MTPPFRARTIYAVSQLYRTAAISNAVVTLPAFISYQRYVSTFATGREPNYPFLVRIWAGMALLWGVSFWDISKDPIKHRDLIKYSYLEKLVTSAAVLNAYRPDRDGRREVPRRLVGLVLVTDAMWIPMFVWAQLKIKKAMT
jgi:hypothetical protein